MKGDDAGVGIEEKDDEEEEESVDPEGAHAECAEGDAQVDDDYVPDDEVPLEKPTKKTKARPSSSTKGHKTAVDPCPPSYDGGKWWPAWLDLGPVGKNHVDIRPAATLAPEHMAGTSKSGSRAKYKKDQYEKVNVHTTPAASSSRASSRLPNAPKRGSEAPPSTHSSVASVTSGSVSSGATGSGKCNAGGGGGGGGGGSLKEEPDLPPLITKLADLRDEGRKGDSEHAEILKRHLKVEEEKLQVAARVQQNTARAQRISELKDLLSLLPESEPEFTAAKSELISLLLSNHQPPRPQQPVSGLGADRVPAADPSTATTAAATVLQHSRECESRASGESDEDKQQDEVAFEDLYRSSQ